MIITEKLWKRKEVFLNNDLEKKTKRSCIAEILLCRFST